MEVTFGSYQGDRVGWAHVLLQERCNGKSESKWKMEEWWLMGKWAWVASTSSKRIWPKISFLRCSVLQYREGKAGKEMQATFTLWLLAPYISVTTSHHSKYKSRTKGTFFNETVKCFKSYPLIIEKLTVYCWMKTTKTIWNSYTLSRICLLTVDCQMWKTSQTN